MQFQSDILDTNVLVPDAEELSGIGAAYAAGIGLGMYGGEVFERIRRKRYVPSMEEERRTAKYAGWKKAVGTVLRKIRYSIDVSDIFSFMLYEVIQCKGIFFEKITA